MNRRHFVQLTLGALFAAPVLAHHGWSSFDQDKPLYLSGTLTQVRWQNPHAEVMLRVDATKLPDGIASRTVPEQQQSVDGAGILKKVQVPANAAGEWEVEFAPLSRMQAWGLSQPPKVGDRVEVIGYGLADEKKRLLRVEYLFVNGKAYAFRSSPVN
ncbi:MAG TPA: DUF6152 family protein [Burkholderiaceae bacterium]|jgi:hypothetical protein|nr:DUF6152 family protein [Burkholderiaceae bacterium]